jgi:outer membrane protein
MCAPENNMPTGYLMKPTLAISTLLALGLATGSALAHKQGDFLVRAGAAIVAPNDKSSQFTLDGAGIGGKATVGDNTQLGLTFAYMLSDNIGLELLAATPFSHRVGIKGLGGLDGKLADVKHLPPTLTLQYYPMDPSSKWQPYVGAGINYTFFFDESLTGVRKNQGFSRLRLSDSVGLAAQIGSDWKINDRLMVNAALWYMDIDTKAKVRLGASSVKVKVDIDPWVVMVGLGYRF